MSAIHESELVNPYDWPSWKDEAERIWYEPGALERVNLETIRK